MVGFTGIVEEGEECDCGLEIQCNEAKVECCGHRRSGQPCRIFNALNCSDHQTLKPTKPSLQNPTIPVTVLSIRKQAYLKKVRLGSIGQKVKPAWKLLIVLLVANVIMENGIK